jgi:hypothetical protein
MRKWVILLLFLFATKISYAQIDRFDAVRDSVVVSVGLHIDFAEERAKELRLYVDSLNNYESGALPKFVTNPCFDWSVWLWESFHSPVSLRWMILARVSSKKALKALLASEDKRLKLVCSRQKDKVYPYLTVDMIEQSTYKLIQKRIRQL